MKSPAVSVILPVYNGGQFLRASIESILHQTFSDFELIIINDGSKDYSEEIIKSFQDHRIRYFYQENQGLGKTLVNAMKLSKGVLIARQDADDISLPTRFEKQIEFLNTHPETALVGTWCEMIDEDGRSMNRFHRHSTNAGVLKFDLVFNNPFVHSSVMFRKGQIESVGGYSPERHSFEDFDLWSRVSHRFAVMNLPEVLLYYREVSTGISKSNADYDLWVYKIMARNVQHYIDSLSSERCMELARIYHGAAGSEIKISDISMKWFILELLENVHPEISEKERQELLNKHYLQMRRKYYNSKIEANLNIAERLYFQMKRKMLFKAHPQIAQS